MISNNNIINYDDSSDRSGNYDEDKYLLKYMDNNYPCKVKQEYPVVEVTAVPRVFL